MNICLCKRCYGKWYNTLLNSKLPERLLHCILGMLTTSLGYSHQKWLWQST